MVMVQRQKSDTARLAMNTFLQSLITIEKTGKEPQGPKYFFYIIANNAVLVAVLALRISWERRMVNRTSRLPRQPTAENT